MRTNLSIITAVGVGALLLSVLTASFTFRAQTAYAQEEEDVQTGDVHLSLLSHSVSPGKNLLGGYGFTNIPCKDKNGDGQCSFLDTFPSNFIFRVDILGSQQGNNGGGNQGGSQGKYSQGRSNNQGGVIVKSFISNPNPLPSYSPQQYQAPLAITIPELMNVRTGPGLTYNIVTTVPAGTQGYIYGIDPDNDWFHIELEGFDTRVWVYQDLTTVVGSLASVKLYTAAEIALLLSGSGGDGSIPLAITVPITLNVRTGPGLLYDIVGIVPKGTQGRIFGIDPDNDWFQIELEAFDTLVWVYQDLTTVVGSLAGVKWVTEAELALLPAAITQPLLLNARAGPGLTFDILTTIPQGTWMKIVGIDTLGEWYRVDLPDFNQQAWIFRDYTKVAGGSLSGLIQLALGGNPPPGSRLTSSITVALSLPPAGGVDLEVSWADISGCAQLYNLYHRSSPDTTVYISLDQAATSSTVNSKSLSFSSLSGSSLILAWCGTMTGGREAAEVEIDPGVAGTYSSTTTSGGLAAVPDTDDGSR
ncbi:MAG: SH3 domain-containing protein [Chloroflexi bacterium]|nr:SH3 domain-containing protein [Chloroflexota bacterium]